MDESNFKPFGAYLAALLKRHKLSAAALSRMLGHKSRTTLRRILLDQANIESMEKFLSEFLNARLLPISNEEEQQLRQSLKISQFGVAGYRTRMEMNRLLTTPLYSSTPRAVNLHNVQNGNEIPLQQFLKNISSARSIRLLIINSPSVDFLETLGRFVPAFHGGHLHIDHYLFLNDDLSRTVRFIAAMLPLLGASCYSAYVIPAVQPEQTFSSTLTSSIVICCVEDSSGKLTEYQLGFTGSMTGELLTFAPGDGVCKFWRAMLEPSLPYQVPILSIGKRSVFPGDYLNISQSYLDLEKNRAIYMIRSEIFPAFLPPDMLVSSLRECCLSDPSLSADQIEPLLKSFSTIHQQRFDNIFHKKRVTHVLMSLQSLRSFVRTGRLNASFLPIRPFTVAERRRILIHLRDQSRDNPYFSIYFPKNDSTPITLDTTCYDPVGVLFYHTALNTDPQHIPYYSNALISLSDFTSLFAQYFRDVLLSYYALSVNASLSLLNSLIDSLPPDDA